MLNYFLGKLFNPCCWRWLGQVRLTSINCGWWRIDPAPW